MGPTADPTTDNVDALAFDHNQKHHSPLQKRTGADLRGGVAARRAGRLLHVEGGLAASSAHDVGLVVAHAKALGSLRLHSTYRRDHIALTSSNQIAH
jgi:hypothetical protein